MIPRIARREAQDLTGQARFAFHIVGDGPAKADVLRAEEKGIVRYHGALPNEAVPDFLRGMDVCVALTFAGSDLASGSGGAGVSNSLLEQMGAGRVLLCWDNPAFRQVLDAESAYFVPQGDVAALQEALAQIADDSQARHPGGATPKAWRADMDWKRTLTCSRQRQIAGCQAARRASVVRREAHSARQSQDIRRHHRPPPVTPTACRTG